MNFLSWCLVPAVISCFIEGCTHLHEKQNLKLRGKYATIGLQRFRKGVNSEPFFIVHTLSFPRIIVGKKIFPAISTFKPVKPYQFPDEDLYQNNRVFYRRISLTEKYL